MANLLVLALSSETRRNNIITDDRIIPMKWQGKYDPFTPVKGVYKEPKDMYDHKPEWHVRGRGDIIEVRKDICAWGRMERLPRFYRICAPSIPFNLKNEIETPYEVYKYDYRVRDNLTDNPLLDYVWKNYYIDFTELTDSQNSYLESTGMLTLNNFEVQRVIKGKKIPFDYLKYSDNYTERIIVPSTTTYVSSSSNSSQSSTSSESASSNSSNSSKSSNSSISSESSSKSSLSSDSSLSSASSNSSNSSESSSSYEDSLLAGSTIMTMSGTGTLST